MKKETMEKVEWIPAGEVKVLNPRCRDPRKFMELQQSIRKLGLKKPLTVTRSDEKNGIKTYLLVCGQGRLEACLNLGMEQVPARVVEITFDHALLHGLIENIARRAPQVKETIEHIHYLKKQGYSSADIGRKVGLSSSQVSRYCSLDKQGETRLLDALLNGRISLEAASLIATSEDEGVRRLLQDAHEAGKISQGDLKAAREIAEDRLVRGKEKKALKHKRETRMSPDELVHAIQKTARKKESIVRKARNCEHTLLFVENSLRRLMQDERFMKILEKELLGRIPASLGQRLKLES